MEETNFGKWLRKARQDADRTLEELSKSLGVSMSHLQQLETRHVKPSEGLAQRCAELLGADAERVVWMARGYPEMLQELKERFPRVSKEYLV